MLYATFGFASGDQRGFASNVAAEVIGIFGAFALAWYFIERRFQDQANRVKQSLFGRLSAVRNAAGALIPAVTTAAFNIPVYDAQNESL